jgi:hypothetical protein
MLDRLRSMFRSLSKRASLAQQAEASNGGPGILDPATLKRMVREIAATHEHEIGCEECFQLMDRFVDLKLAGKNAAQAMPLVQEHLDRCDDCREEFEALLAALRGLS